MVSKLKNRIRIIGEGIMVAVENRERNYSYSELGKMIEDLKECNY